MMRLAYLSDDGLRALDRLLAHAPGLTWKIRLTIFCELLRRERRQHADLGWSEYIGIG